MRRRAKVDRNQSEIVHALRAAGATVQALHTVGAGCPDLLVGFRGSNFLIEVKDWKAAVSDRQLNPVQVQTDHRDEVMARLVEALELFSKMEFFVESSDDTDPCIISAGTVRRCRAALAASKAVRK